MTSETSKPIPPVVMKFGGAALADGAGIRRVGAILAARGGARPVAVVSAAHGVTELLVQAANAAAEGRSELERVRIRHRTLLAQCGLEQELLDRLLAELAAMLESIRAKRTISAAERDFVLSFGERMSARIVAASLRGAGHAATPVDAFDLGLLSDSNHGQARPLSGNSAAIRRALEAVPGIPVVTGFVAKDAAGNLTTLGRNGSDLSASLLGEACGAREVQFWKVVGGVMSADPSQVPDARRVAQLSYAEAAEYAFRGANVLHPGALEPLERANIPARVLCISDADGAGTWIGREARRDEVARGASAVGVTARRGLTLAHVELGQSEDRAQRSSEFLARLARANIEPLWLSAGPRELCVACGWSDDLASLLAGQREIFEVERSLALIALVGPTASEIEAARRVLDEAGIDVRAQWAESDRGSALFAVSEAALPAALRAVHAAVFELCAPLSIGF
ncbi:MAG TPA: aspartate kinase [Planctomycetota bacterium]|nr:aspartate kinase [Planctomycetota bacterium]